MSRVETAEKSSDDPRVGTTLVQRYQVVRVLGYGGIGAVYYAEDTITGSHVAVKFLKQEMCEKAEILARFEREARAMATIHHAHAVQALDFGRTEDGAAFMVMEYVHGETLRSALIRNGPLSMETAVEYARQIGGALSAAHALGLVHRDLKPENVMVTLDQDDVANLKLLDFGMARAIGGAFSWETPLTREGKVFGTPEYMSPEQASGRKVDARADQYTLGLMLYELTSGHLPFTGETPLEVVQAQIHKTPRPLTQLVPSLPRTMVRVIERMMSKDANDRYADINTAMRELRNAASGESPDELLEANPSSVLTMNSRVRVIRVLVIAIVIGVLAAALEWWARSSGSIQ